MGVLECWMVLRGLTMTRKLERVGQAHSSMEARWFFADCGASRQTVRIAQRDLHGPLGRSCLPFMEDFGVTDLAWQSAYHEVVLLRTQASIPAASRAAFAIVMEA